MEELHKARVNNPTEDYQFQCLFFSQVGFIHLVQLQDLNGGTPQVDENVAPKIDQVTTVAVSMESNESKDEKQDRSVESSSKNEEVKSVVVFVGRNLILTSTVRIFTTVST